MFKYEFIRFIRSYFKPLDPEFAQKWYDRARFAYLFIGFQSLGVAYYFYQKDKLDLRGYEVEETQVEKAVRVLGLKNVKVVTAGKDSTQPYMIDAQTVKKSLEEKKKKIYEKYSV